MKWKTSDFDYNLPEELIAQTPLLDRSSSRMLVIHNTEKKYEDKHFYDIVDYLHAGDVLVRNNTRVIPARLFGTKEETGACVEIGEKGLRKMRMIYDGIFNEILDELGNVPLPPYIKEKLNDPERYQTVYAKVRGSAAAPTAGLHFTDEIFTKLKEKGVAVIDVTLHVGLGTFRPMDTEDVEDHDMHSEVYYMSKEAADTLNAAKANGQRIFAIGTTSVRTLESVWNRFGKFEECSGETKLFIYPGQQWHTIDGMLTNVHLPKSTLIMMIASFVGYEFTLEAYRHAVQGKYRFFSFGDCMLITNE